MITDQSQSVVQRLEVKKEERIAAPIDIVFDTLIEQITEFNGTPEKPMPMKLEAWPAGRWYRDLATAPDIFGVTSRSSSLPVCWKSADPCSCPFQPYRTFNIA